jgi:hypothetical protein
MNAVRGFHLVWCRKPGESGLWATVEWLRQAPAHVGYEALGDANVMRYDASSRVEVMLRRGDVVHGATAGWCRGCVRLRQAASVLLCLCERADGVRQAAKANRDLTSFAPWCHDLGAFLSFFFRGRGVFIDSMSFFTSRYEEAVFKDIGVLY